MNISPTQNSSASLGDAELTQEMIEKIDHEIAKFPSGKEQSAVIAALRIVQQVHGWLDSSLIKKVADYLKMPSIAAMEVATFYNMFNLKPVGKYKITVCTNLPCQLSGGVHAANYLKEKLGIQFGQTTEDGKYTLSEGECMGACGDAPVLLLNNIKMCSFMTEEAIDQLLKECD